MKMEIAWKLQKLYEKYGKKITSIWIRLSNTFKKLPILPRKYFNSISMFGGGNRLGILSLFFKLNIYNIYIFNQLIIFVMSPLTFVLRFTTRLCFIFSLFCIWIDTNLASNIKFTSQIYPYNSVQENTKLLLHSKRFHTILKYIIFAYLNFIGITIVSFVVLSCRHITLALILYTRSKHYNRSFGWTYSWDMNS